MTPEDWMAHAGNLATQHAGYSGADDTRCRRALLEIHALFKAAPHAAQEAYSNLTESQLTAIAETRSDAIIGGDFSWQTTTASDLRVIVVTAGAQARALDDVLMTWALTHSGSVDPDEWFCREVGAFAIPRPRHREKAEKREGQRFDRRGILRHRIIPHVVAGGLRVELIRHDTTSAPPGNHVTMGAALFPGLVLKTDPGPSEGQFLATGIDCPGAPATVRRQIDAAYSDSCFAMAWPELTITPELLGTIVGALEARLMTPCPPGSLQLVVAGSWHLREGGKVYNVAVVLDGYGGETLRYRKVLAYRDGRISKDSIGREGIDVPAMIPVLVTDDHLVGFGICKDFCDVGVNLPYLDLDVDLMLVPSMGNSVTMDGHRQTAKTMRTRFGTRAFVVQQADPDAPAADKPGWGLPIPNAPTLGPIENLRQAGDWASYSGLVPRGRD